MVFSTSASLFRVVAEKPVFKKTARTYALSERIDLFFPGGARFWRIVYSLAFDMFGGFKNAAALV